MHFQNADETRFLDGARLGVELMAAAGHVPTVAEGIRVANAFGRKRIPLIGGDSLGLVSKSWRLG